jgi:hypothetical protein
LTGSKINDIITKCSSKVPNVTRIEREVFSSNLVDGGGRRKRVYVVDTCIESVVLSGIAPSLGDEVNELFTFGELIEIGPDYSQITDL